MMKKIIAFMISVVILTASLPVSTSATENFMYNDDQINDLYESFLEISDIVETTYGDVNYSEYWRTVTNVKKDTELTHSISCASSFLGVDVDKEYYAEVLSGMMVLFDMGFANQVNSQSQFDKTKSFGEYALKAIDIGVSVAAMKCKEFKKAADVIDVVLGGIDTTVKNVDHAKYYEAIIKSYAGFEVFLSAISDYSENAELAEVAKQMRDVNETLFKERAKLVGNIAFETGSYTTLAFLDKFSIDILKNTSLYKEDKFVKLVADKGDKVTGLNSLISTMNDIIVLYSDLSFGATNSFRSIDEMMVMGDIADALKKAYENITVTDSLSSQEKYSKIVLKCDLYRLLLSTHLRGEYLLQKLYYNDMGVISFITKVVEGLVEENGTYKDWYDDRVFQLNEVYKSIDDLFLLLLPEEYTFELYDGFIEPIEQKTEVPEGYVGIYDYNDLKKIADSFGENSRVTSIDPLTTPLNVLNYILMADITIPDGYESIPTFYGAIDGNGYSIKNINNPLFEYVGNAEFRNIGLEVKASYILDKDYECFYGAIAKYTNAFGNKEGIIIDNCFVKGSIEAFGKSCTVGGLLGSTDSSYGTTAQISNCYNLASIYASARHTVIAGGICGKGAQITNCFNNGTIYSHSLGKNIFNEYSIEATAGGIQGYVYSETITHCYNTASVTAKTGIQCNAYCGGIVGYLYGSDINNCYNIADVLIQSDKEIDTESQGSFAPQYCAGGIAGLIRSSADVLKSWNMGNVTSNYYSGGVVGYQNGDSDVTDCYNIGYVTGVKYAGGIVGIAYGDVVNCINMGGITPTDYPGAIVGDAQGRDGSIENCYYLKGSVKGLGAGVDLSSTKALSETELSSKKSFTDFDFKTIWRLKSDLGYPTLRFVY